MLPPAVEPTAAEGRSFRLKLGVFAFAVVVAVGAALVGAPT
ncbi:MAG: hypothetical protein U0231_02955 [Nitrospiraceae bacterium]